MQTSDNKPLSNEDLWAVLDGESANSKGHTAGIEDSHYQSADDGFDDDLDNKRTLQTFAGSPLARLGLAAGVGLVLILAIGTLMGGLSGSVKEANKKPANAPSQGFENPMVSQGNQNGDLKAQMAFQTQAQALQQQSAQPKPTVTPKPPTIKATPSPPPQTVTPPPPPPAVLADPPPTAPVHVDPAPLPIVPLPQIPLDPNKEWQDLSQSATYGSLPMLNLAPPPPPPVLISAPASTSKTTGPSSDMGGLPSLSSLNLQSSLPVRKIRIGTTAKATLVTPIAWAGDGQNVAFSANGASTPKFIVRLEEPLKDTNGEIVVPKGGEIVTAVSQLEPTTGLAELTALQFIVNDQEYAPPDGAVTLRGANGNPLIADKFQDKGKEIAAADRASFFFGALSKVGSLMNRSDSEVVVTANGSSSSSSRSGKPNLLGGILEGGFTALAQQQQQRNQQWLQEIIQRPDVRYIPSGKPLTIYINQTVTL
jgi:Bacterial conjugation TrbI-like protein